MQLQNAPDLKTPKSTSNLKKNLPALALLALSLALLIWADASVIIPLKELNLPNSGNDFGVFWSGTRTVAQGGNPYLTAPGSIYRNTVIAAGGNLQPLEPFISPFYLTLLFMPVAIFPLGIAALIWTVAEQVLLAIALVLIIRISGRKQTPGSLLLGIGMAMLLRYTFLVMMVGNLTLLLLFAVTASYYSSRKGRPFLAGIFAALLLLKPQIVFLILPFLLVVPTLDPSGVAGWLNRQTYRRWLGFICGGLIFAVYSFVLLPGWLSEWIKGVSATGYSDSNNLDGVMTSLRSLAAVLVPDKSMVQPVMFLMAIPLWLGLGLLWWRNRSNVANFPYLLAISVTLNIMTTPYIRDYDSALLIFPLILSYFSLRNYELTHRQGLPWSLVCWLLALLPVPVHLMAGTFTYALENLVTFLVICTVALAWFKSNRLKGTTESLKVTVAG
ncbi:MAG TPA: glycosyltransferase family 87 protein [Chloroflexia bacterium]|nr:glycosyltransferase family 87 protein [Chloroflexia bacterium]